MNINLYIVASPFQLFCAVEAKEQFICDKSILIILYKRKKKDNIQINTMLNKYYNKFDTIIKIADQRYYPKLLHLSLLIFFWRLKNVCFQKLFLGEPRDKNMLLFPLNLSHHECYYMDDGNITLCIQEEIINGKYLNDVIWKSSRKAGILRKFIFTILRLKHEKTCKIVPNWYTCFDLSPIHERGQKILTNNFTYAKRNIINTVNNDNLVYFISSPLSENKIVSENDELRFVELLAKYYAQRSMEIIYCTHRRDSEEKIKKIANINGIKHIRNGNMPLEIDFHIQKENVNNIASFISTALFSLTKIYKIESAILFKLPMQSINHKSLDEVRSVYLSYEKAQSILSLNIEDS